jgi:hypothetical protein
MSGPLVLSLDPFGHRNVGHFQGGVIALQLAIVILFVYIPYPGKIRAHYTTVRERYSYFAIPYDKPFNIIILVYNLMIDYGRIYKDIMSLDPKIRLVTICNRNGKIIYSQHREGVKNLLSPEESEKSLELAINAWKVRSELSNKIGKGKYVLAEYEKIKRITMPLGDKHLLYVTTEVEADHSNVICGIAKMSVE